MECKNTIYSTNKSRFVQKGGNWTKEAKFVVILGAYNFLLIVLTILV